MIAYYNHLITLALFICAALVTGQFRELGTIGGKQARTTGCHAISFPLTTEYGASHGTACAITLPAFVRIVNEGAAEKMDMLCRNLGCADTNALADALEALMVSMKMPAQLRQLGVKEETLDHITEVDLGAAIIQLTPAAMNHNTVRALLKSILENAAGS